MAESGDEERRFFGNIVRNQAKYGATTKPGQEFSKYIEHCVCRTDTLQGLALKYGSTVELIKRTNKLWTNDSLFLQENVYIPVTVENSHMIQDDWTLLFAEDVRARSCSDTSPSMAEHTSQGSPDTDNGALSPAKTNGTVSDFFSKYDSKIADLKCKVNSLEKSSSHRDDPNLSALIPRRHSETSRPTRTKSRTISLESPDSPVLIIRTNTQNYRVQHAVKRSEQAQEDLFEL